jgi:hypothetical protein
MNKIEQIFHKNNKWLWKGQKGQQFQDFPDNLLKEQSNKRKRIGLDEMRLD